MTITPEIRDLLPDVLTDYLCGLIAAETEDLDAALVECRLEISEKGGRPIQRVECFGKRHFVFGFTPVACRLLVLVSRDCCKLMLIER